jgi:hypothetical protein
VRCVSAGAELSECGLRAGPADVVTRPGGGKKQEGGVLSSSSHLTVRLGPAILFLFAVVQGHHSVGDPGE